MPDETTLACVRALIEQDGLANETCSKPWRWRDEVGEDMSYFRIVEIVREVLLIDGQETP